MLPKHKHMYTCFEGYSPLSALVLDSLICVLNGLRQNNGFLNLGMCMLEAGIR